MRQYQDFLGSIATTVVPYFRFRKLHLQMTINKRPIYFGKTWHPPLTLTGSESIQKQTKLTLTTIYIKIWPAITSIMLALYLRIGMRAVLQLRGGAGLYLSANVKMHVECS